MPKIRLTAAAVERLPAPSSGQVDYYDAYLPAFGLRISYSGTRAWFVMTRVDGRLVRITLGRPPSVALADAREKARAAVEQARSGRDPRILVAEERQRRIVERRTTFELTAAQFIQRYVERKLRPNTAREYRRILQGSDTQEWRSRPLTSLTRSDVFEVLSRIEVRAPAAANRSLACLSKFFSWCREQDFIASSPTDRVRVGSGLQSRDQVHGNDEFGWIWRGFEIYPGIFGSFFKATLLTGQRRGEVAAMHWDELTGIGGEDALWHLPSECTKNARSHYVPLAPAVQQIITSIPRRGLYVFSTNDRSPVSGFSKAN